MLVQISSPLPSLPFDTSLELARRNAHDDLVARGEVPVLNTHAIHFNVNNSFGHDSNSLHGV